MIRVRMAALAGVAASLMLAAGCGGSGSGSASSATSGGSSTAGSAAQSASANSASQPSSSAGVPETKNLNIVYLWTPQGHAADLVATVDGGFLAKKGLSAKLIVPGSPTDSIKLVASGTAQIGIAHSSSILIARSQGIPLVAIATRHQYGTNGVLVMANSNIKSLKDLAGKTVGMTGIPANQVAFEQMLKLHGVDPSTVKMVNVGFSGAQQLAAGKVQALGDAISWYEPLLVNISEGKNPLDTSTYHFYPYYKNGLPRYYTYVIFTTKQFAQQNPNTLKAFLAAWQEGMTYAQQNPQAAVNMVLKRYPSNTALFAQNEWKALLPFTTSPETKAHGLGWMSPTVWNQYATFLAQQGQIKSASVANGAFTNQFLPGQ